jgi:hypothetical protein
VAGGRAEGGGSRAAGGGYRSSEFFVGSISRSSSGQNSFPDRLRQLDFAEECFRIQIIIAGLVDDPNEVMLFSSEVAKCDQIFRLSSDASYPSLSMHTTSCFVLAMIVRLKADA